MSMSSSKSTSWSDTGEESAEDAAHVVAVVLTWTSAVKRSRNKSEAPAASAHVSLTGVSRVDGSIG